MSDEIRPALSAEEWREWLSPEFADLGIPQDLGHYPRHVVAALCLYQQPFGFTREDVELLNRCANGCDGTVSDEDDDRVFPDGIVMHMRDVRRLWSLAERIAALLPPSDSEDPR